MTRGMTAIAVALLLAAGCSGGGDDPERAIDTDAWRTSVENQLRGDDGKIPWEGRRQDRIPGTAWDEFVDYWLDVCALDDDDMSDAVAEWTNATDAHIDMAETNIRYACPDRLDTVTGAR